MNRPTERPPQDDRVVANFSIIGSGTVDEPAIVEFNINGSGLDSQGVRTVHEALPNIVELTPNVGGYRLTGVNPAMSRSALRNVFLDLCTAREWNPREFA